MVGRMSLLSIALLIFCTTTGISAFSSLGCVFENQYYGLRAPSLKSPVWGEHISPMIFHSNGEFKQFLNTVKRHHSNLMANTKFYNEYHQYMNTHDADFNDFFQSYQPRFRPNEDCSGMAIELFNRIAYEVPDVQYHSYLTTCAMNIQKDAYGSLNEWTGRLPREFIHDHVAGFIRISIQNRLGYVILDPGLAVQYPVVIMEDGQDPHLPVSFGLGRDSRGQNFEFQLLGLDTSYILAKTFLPNSRIPDEAFLYAVGSPYCSFLETTTKPNQLNLFKCMVSRNATGAATAAVYVNLKASDGKPLVFNVALYGGSKRRFSVPLSQPNQMNQTQNADFNTVAEYLGVTRDELLKKMMSLHTIASDTNFIAASQSMLADLDPPPSSPSNQGSPGGLDKAREYDRQVPAKKKNSSFFKSLLSMFICGRSSCTRD
ncbi:hypothetical protein M8J76_006705 [Diaphorina citri]|nr:hypothetical protein M8J75_003430 [Diaphorina citri]KAI5692557.1 hypothetical protein M8J75_000276 [Diaphorina citri]KAI5694452.1 hypothetical protein M8J76_010197 [Diaphorina citri]KAI5695518.1 hypothetical protein M8J76_010958 [Diaphorina citri]KAI5740749.1 hypothetical protein M8J76_006705 [Diaphorina citri]